MSLMWSQLFLHLNTYSPTIHKSYYSEGFCHSVCNVANHLLLMGEYNTAHCILTFVKEKFPHEPLSQTWMLCKNLFSFIRSLHHEDWLEAQAAAQRIVVLDKWEGYLRLAELYMYKQDYAEAYRCVNEVANSSQKDSSKPIGFQLRALILLAEIQSASSFPDDIPAGVVILLNSCLNFATEHHLDYYAALVHLHLAKIQLLLGMPAQALKLMDKCLIQILAHGGNFDRARAMQLYVQCLVAALDTDNVQYRQKTMLESAFLLNEVKEEFGKVEAYVRVRDVLYLQVSVYHFSHFSFLSSGRKETC